jgi:hypothetical protein
MTANARAIVVPVVSDFAAHLLVMLARKLFGFLRAPICTDQRLDMIGGAVQCDLQEVVLVLRRRHARDGADFRVADFAALHGR